MPNLAYEANHTRRERYPNKKRDGISIKTVLPPEITCGAAGLNARANSAFSVCPVKV